MGEVYTVLEKAQRVFSSASSMISTTGGLVHFRENMELEYNIHFKIRTIINLKYKSNNNNLGLFFQKLKEKVEKVEKVKKASEDLSTGTPKSAEAKKAREAEAKEAKELHQKVKNTTF